MCQPHSFSKESELSLPSTTPTLETDELCRVAVAAAAEKKATRPVVLDVSEVLGIVDAFVICSGSNDRQVRTIAEEIEQKVKDAGGPPPLSVEGLDHARWVLLDYGDVAVHIFIEEARAFYDLERLWKDAPRWGELPSVYSGRSS